MTTPSYLRLFHEGSLSDRVDKARQMLVCCTVCPHHCKTDRLKGDLGICRIGAKARVASYGPHFGEESPLVGRNGSGTIFFEGCNLRCLFCQNCDISHIDKKGDASPHAIDEKQLANIMLSLQEQGCHNINLVTPSHVVPQILAAIQAAAAQGLQIPLVYNSGGFDSTETLRLLDGIIDIYMPDCKFISSATAAKYTHAPKYPRAMKEAVLEMHRQVGDLQINNQGMAVRGLLVRHLVMPGHLDETEGILDFLAREVSIKTYINIMDQYRPCHQAFGMKPINRALSPDEYEQALKMAEKKGLRNLDQRDWKKIIRMLGL